MGSKWRLRNLHMLLEILEFIVETKKKLFKENCFENVVSDLKENELSVHKTTLKQNAKKKNS